MGEYFTSDLFCLQMRHLAFVSVSGRDYPEYKTKIMLKIEG
jgi:hypothetical protein